MPRATSGEARFWGERVRHDVLLHFRVSAIKHGPLYNAADHESELHPEEDDCWTAMQSNEANSQLNQEEHLAKVASQRIPGQVPRDTRHQDWTFNPMSRLPR